VSISSGMNVAMSLGCYIGVETIVSGCLDSTLQEVCQELHT
jgi:hypothetical protein